MKNNSVSAKDLQHPTSKYDYDGITGTWLLIPAKFHILICALLLPIIIWVFPLVHFKGEFRYIFADYRYYIAGATAIFCLSSAILSIIKAKQVKQRLRPMNRVSNQVIAKKHLPSSESSTQSTAKRPKTSDKHPKVHIGQIAPNGASSKQTSQKDVKKNTASKNTKVQAASTSKTVQTDISTSQQTEKRGSKEALPKNSIEPKAVNSAAKIEEKPKKPSTSKTKVAAQKKSSAAPKSTKSKTTAAKKSQKNSQQMQLDL